MKNKIAKQMITDVIRYKFSTIGATTDVYCNDLKLLDTARELKEIVKQIKTEYQGLVGLTISWRPSWGKLVVQGTQVLERSSVAKMHQKNSLSAKIEAINIPSNIADKLPDYVRFCFPYDEKVELEITAPYGMKRW